MTEKEFYAELNRLLPENTEYVGWYDNDIRVTLDGSFTADELRIIADLVEKAAE